MLDTTTDPIDPRHPPEPAPRLVRPRDEARKLLVNQIKIGQAIRSQRIDYVDDLEEARAEKQEWVTRSTDLLKQSFSDSSIADQCNDWVGPILPEYAEFDLFVEQFANEMKHRVGRLQSLAKRLDQIPEVATVEAPMIATRQTPGSVTAPSIRWSGLLISHSADETMQQSVTTFLEKLDVSVDTVDSIPGGAAPAHDLVEFALILKGSSQTGDDDTFELGFCVGRFGTQRVCVLHRDAAPPATRGVCHIALDPAGAWQLALARHLKAGGATIDLNRLV